MWKLTWNRRTVFDRCSRVSFSSLSSRDVVSFCAVSVCPHFLRWTFVPVRFGLWTASSIRAFVSSGLQFSMNWDGCELQTHFVVVSDLVSRHVTAKTMG